MATLHEINEQESLIVVARRLAQANAEAEDTIQAIYLFPDDKEIRLIALDEDSPSGIEAQIQPYYFQPAPSVGNPYWSAIALIRPGEKGRLLPPEGWGDWSTARKIWPEE